METEEMTTEETRTGASNAGAVRGVPGEHVSNVGLLDLRGATPEELGRLRRISNVGLVLVGRGQSSALANVLMENTGTLAEADADEHLLIGPTTEFTRGLLESMDPGLRLTVVGVVTFASDIPPALLTEKIASLRVVGVLIAPVTVQGALMGRMEHTGVAVQLKSDGLLVKNMGETRITPSYLSYMTPGSLYLNMGQIEIDARVTVAALAEKIGGYYNMGQTIGSEDVIDWLRVKAELQAGELTVRSDG